MVRAAAAGWTSRKTVAGCCGIVGGTRVPAGGPGRNAGAAESGAEGGGSGAPGG
ncbi:MAG: hypothetical protein QM820_31345 [Minicystis sp.]